MPAIEERRERARAALFGATAALLQSRERISPPPPGVLLPKLRPPPIDSLASLVESKDDDDPQARLARISASALLSTIRGVDTKKIKRLLSSEERERLDSAYSVLNRETENNEPHCRHCTVFQHLAYPFGPRAAPVAPIGGAHGDARIVTSFNSDTSVSAAEIKRHEFFVEGEIAARQVIERAHPLHWETNGLWEHADAVERQGNDWVSLGIADNARDWVDQDGHRFLFESVKWPWNESLNATVENILRIDLDQSRPEGYLAFQYSLEKCCSSNFGISWENAGMDVDCGYYEGRFEPLSIVARTTSSGVPRLNAKDLIETGKTLEREWTEEPHLVTISAKKSLRYTMPKNGPREMWALLNWTAPVLLFNFLNLSICQIPHLLSVERQANDRRPPNAPTNPGADVIDRHDPALFAKEGDMTWR
jgi:hypothetical protein